MLVLSRRQNECILIERDGEVIELVVMQTTAGRVRIGIDAPESYVVTRKELKEIEIKDRAHGNGI